MGIVRVNIDLNNIPEQYKMTQAEKDHYDNLADADIDYSDSPEITEEWFEKAVRIKDLTDDDPLKQILQPIKKKEQISLRLDHDVLVWLRSYGKGYQTRINEILKREMEKCV